MLPIQAPIQIIPETIIFLDCPPTFEVINDSDKTVAVNYECLRQDNGLTERRLVTSGEIAVGHQLSPV
jgi:hypothetical protein